MEKRFKVLLRHLLQFQPRRDCADEIWSFHVPAPHSKRKWLYQSFTRYRDVIYWCVNYDVQMECDLKNGALSGTSRPTYASEHYDIPLIIASTVKTLKAAQKDWLRYHRWLLRTLPKQYRFGLIQRRILWKIVPDMYRPDQELSRRDHAQLAEIFRQQERGREELAIASPTLQTYLDYCRVAYLANVEKYKERIRKQMSGLEMYQHMADGRHEGLLDLPPDSTDALVAWYRSGRVGGHPWEICRGGNTTHINLGIMHENDRWYFFLDGNSTGRMLETCRMALALYTHKMPFRWLGFGDVQLKLLGCDNIGLIPEYHALHRAWQMFEQKDHVFDCLHLRDLGRARRSTEPLIAFFPLEPLYPVSQ